MRVVLIGREGPGEENLGVRYVAAALARTGHRPSVLVLDGPAQIDRVARHAMDADAPLVGLAISDPVAALDHLVVAELMRRRGYAGHITAGGALATLARHQLLERHRALDSVVRHQGELPMCELAHRLAAGLDWEPTPGLTSRHGDGPPARVAARGWPGLRPLRSASPRRVLGIPAARVVGSRGCLGHCAYCGSLALQQQALAEARQSGLSDAALRLGAVGGRQRRSPDDLADEVSELYRERGVRIIQVMDDNLLGGDAGRSEPWLRQLIDALARRRAGPMAYSLMIDPDSVTDSMLDAFELLGVARVMLGVEALTDRGLASLGRPGSAERNRRAIERLSARGIAVLFNSIAVHPSATAVTLRAEIEALSRVEGGYFELLPLALHTGTELLDRLCQKGRAEGGLLGHRWQPSDPVVSRFAAVVQRFALHRWFDTGLYAHGLAANLAILRRLGRGVRPPELEREALGLLRAVNLCWVEAWRAALAVCSLELGLDERTRAVAALTRSTGYELERLGARVEDLHRRVSAHAGVRADRHGFLFGRAVTTGFFAFLAAACGARTEARATESTAPLDATLESISSGQDAGTDLGLIDHGSEVDAGQKDATASGLDSGRDASQEPIPPVDAAAAEAGVKEASVATGTDSGTDASAPHLYRRNCAGENWYWQERPPPGATEWLCTEESSCSEVSRARALVENGCFPLCSDLMGFQPPNGRSLANWGIALDASGKVLEVLVEREVPEFEEVRQCALEVLKGETFPCLSDGEIWQSCYFTTG